MYGRPASVKRRKLNNGDHVWQRSTDGEWDDRISVLVQTIRCIYTKIVAGESPSESTWKTKLFLD
jgi:hypothetical protein